MDGHSSHATLALSDFCVEHKIELISLYPNSTHVTQPMDVAYFRPLKAAWKKAVTSWRLTNNGASLQKCHFATVLKSAIDSMDTKTTLANGFACCGLSPFSADSVNYSRLLNNRESSKTETLTADSSNEYAKASTLNFVENFVDKKILNMFKAAAATDNKWFGEVRYLELFSLWLECQKSSRQMTNPVERT